MALCTSGGSIAQLGITLHAPCRRELVELPYMARDGSASAVLVCPRCDGPAAKPAG